MELTPPSAVRTAALLGASALVATLAVAIAPADEADAGRPCRISTSASLDSKTRLAGGAVLRRYTATAQGLAKGGYDQKANAILTSWPTGAYPSLINPRIGERTVTGAMVKNQQPQALGAINGDFFLWANIRSVTNIEMSRGPMVRDGRIIRGSKSQQVVVGVDTNGQPYGATLGVRGSIAAQLPTATPTPIVSVNWHKIVGGGVNVYTTVWSDAVSGGRASTPRPAGAVEWVLNSRDKIKTIRSATNNTRQLGDPVAAGTRVLAFANNAALGAVGVPVGTKINVKAKQATAGGVKLRTAIGRGFALVDGGVAAPRGCRSYDISRAARPRTIIGWNKYGQWRTVTIPGTHFDGDGLRQGGFGLANVANVAKKLGLVNAYEIDGGGSTTLWTRSTSGTWSRRDLYGVDTSICSCERPVTNGLAFLAGP